MICLYMWIERLIVVEIEFICQNSYVWICCVFVKKVMNEWSCILLNLEWINDKLWLMMFENMLLMNWYDDYAYWWFGDESCCCCWIIMKVLVNFWIGTKWCLFHEFWAFLCMCLCTWPINFIWDEFWVWRIKIGLFGKKCFEIRSFYSGLKSVRLSDT